MSAGPGTRERIKRVRGLSSRDRMLAALRCAEPDHVPLLFEVFGFQPPAHLAWSNQVEAARRWLSLGVDGCLNVRPPSVFHPDVTTREREETVPGEQWPCIIKEYETPAGVLRQEVYRTEDWDSPDWPAQHDDGLNLLDDYNTPRYRRCPIRTEADLEKLRYLFHPLDGEPLRRFRETAAEIARQARELEVLLVGIGGAGVDTAFWLCGVEPTILMALDRPEMFQALMNIIHERDRRLTEILLDTSVDLIRQRGYYEGTTFWSPELYRRFFLPLRRELAEMVHQAGRKLSFTMSVGWQPLLETIAETGCDAHFLLDPIPNGTRVDLAEVKAAYRGKVAVVGGLNDPITLERGTPEDIRREVHEAVRTLAPGGGLVLSAAEGIYASTPWQSIETLLEAWREVRDYPLAGQPGVACVSPGAP